MPGFFSWVSDFFSSNGPSAPQAEPRLFNPVNRNSATSEQEIALVRRLEDHLFCWLLDSPPAELRADVPRMATTLDQPGERLATSSIDELPRQPMSLPMLMRALSDESSDRQRLGHIILSDPALTDQLLQIANSPYFRSGDQAIESVDQAIFLLGIDGIRNVISAAVMRPMMVARNSREALFAQRVWRWGLACARSAELIAKLQGQDTNAFFMVGLLPALSYITLRRELQRIYRGRAVGAEPEPVVIRQALARYQWTTSQLLANEWNLPPQYHAYLLAAERPSPRQAHTPLNDGMIIGSREVLRHAHQRNMAEDNLRTVIRLDDGQFDQVRQVLLQMLEGSNRARP